MPIHIIGQLNNKYSVVLSNEIDAEKVLSKMKTEKGSWWTIWNEPYYVSETHRYMDEWMLEDMVIKTMVKYGIDNVRGGAYSNDILSDDDKIILERNTKAIVTASKN